MSRIDSILDHIAEDCEDIQQFIRDIDETRFIHDKLVMKAVCMSLINIGELVKALPQEFCLEHGELPWKRIAGMRDLVAHKYKTLDMRAVWLVAKERVPEMLAYIQQYRKAAE